MSGAKSEARKAASKAGTTVSGGHATAGTPSSSTSASSSGPSGSGGGKSNIQKTLELEKINPQTVTPSQYGGLSEAAKAELQRQGYVPPPTKETKTSDQQFYESYLRSQGLDPGTEAAKQAERAGITASGKFRRELSQSEFEGLSPALRKEYNVQAEQSQKDYAEYYKSNEEKAKADLKEQAAREKALASGVIKIGGADVLVSLLGPAAREQAGLPPTDYSTTPDLGDFIVTPQTRQQEQQDVITGEATKEEDYLSAKTKADIKQYETLVKQFKATGNTDQVLYEKLSGLLSVVNKGLEADYEAEVKARKQAYEESITKEAAGIVFAGKAKGATRIQIYNPEGKPVGALNIEGAVEPLKYLLRTGEFGYGYTIPKTEAEKAESEKLKEQNKKYWEFIKSEQRLGASGFELSAKLVDVGKGGQGPYVEVQAPVTTISADHPKYDILKAEKKYGPVTAKAQFSLETIAKAYLPTEVPKTVGDVIQQGRESTRAGLGTYQAIVTWLAADIAQATGIPNALKVFGGIEAEKAVEEFREKFSPPTVLDPVFTGRPTEESFAANVGSGIAYATTFGLFGLRRGIKKVEAEPEWIGVDIARPPIRVREPPTLTKVTFRPTNMMREQIPKDIFQFDTAPTPAGSLEKPMPKTPQFEEVSGLKRNKRLEDTSFETQKELQKTQGVLLEPISPRIEPPPKVLGPTFTQRIETGGRPPVSSPTEIFGETSEGAVGLFSAEGKIVGSVSESGLPEGALIRMRTPRAEIIESTYIKPEHKVYSSKGKELGMFGERDLPIGAMKKIEPFVQEPLPASLTGIIETKGRPPIPPKPTDIFGESKLSLKEPTVSAETTEFTFIKPEHEVYSAKGKFLGQFVEKSPPLGAMGKTIKIKLVEEERIPTNLRDYYTRLARTKGPKKLGKIDTGKLLGGKTPPEDLAAGISPIKIEYVKEIKPVGKGFEKELTAGISPLKPKLRKEIGGFESPIERASMPPQEEGIGALGKVKSELLQEDVNYKPSTFRENAERLTPNIVKGKKVKPARAVQKVDTESVLGLEKKPSQGLIESQFRKFVEGTKLLKKEVQLDVNYRPSTFREEAKRFEPDVIIGGKRFTKERKAKEIDTDKILGIEQPEIGAPKDFEQAIPKELTRAEKKRLRALQWGQKKTKPAGKKLTPREKYFKQQEKQKGKPFKESETKGRQQLVQVLEEPIEPKPTVPGAKKIITKAASRQIEPKAVYRLLVTTRQEQEEKQLKKGKIKSVGKTILITQPKIEEGEKLTGILKPIVGTKGGLKTGTELGTKPKSDVLTKLETIQTPKEEEKVRLGTKLTPRMITDMSTPFRGKAKQTLAQPQKQKQPQKLVLERPPPLKPKRLIIPFGILPRGRRTRQLRESETGLRADFLGNVPQSRVVGIYGKRADITYGQKKINKLLGQDRPKGRKFVKVRGVSLFKERPKKFKPKKERMHRLI